MAVSNKKRKQILREYPESSVDQLAEKIGLKKKEVIRVLEESGMSIEVPSENAGAIGLSDSKPVSWMSITIICAVTLVVYANSLQNDFHYDDLHSITRNIQLQYLRNIPQYFVHPEHFSSKPNVAMPRPILLSTFAINYALTEYNAWSWLLVNILLHLANVLLVYLAVCHIAGKDKIALAAAIIFALHPVNTESVNYINCRSETLSALFIILTIYFFCRDLRENKTWLYIAALISYAVGLLTKETVFVVPALLVVIDGLFIFRPRIDSLAKRIYNKYLAIIILSAAYLAYRNIVLTWTFVEKVNRDVSDNILTQTRSLVHYLNLLLVPIHLNTSYENIDYTRLIQDGVLFNMLYLAALLALALALWRKLPVVTFFVLNFFITLAPTSSFIPLNAYLNEHRAYLPSIGFAIMAAAALEKLKTSKPFGMQNAKNIVNILFILIIVMYAALASSRNFIWKTDMTVWTDTIHKSPQKAQVISDLGNAYYRLTTPNIERAADLYKWSIRVDPRYYKAYHNLGTVNYAWAMKASDAQTREEHLHEAEKYFRKALTMMPNNPETWNDLGSTYIQLRRFEDAEYCYRQATTFDPDQYKAWQNLGMVVQWQNRPEEAMNYFKKSIEVYDKDPTPYYLIAKTLVKKEKYQEALQYFAMSAQLSPPNDPKFVKEYENFKKFLAAMNKSNKQGE